MVLTEGMGKCVKVKVQFDGAPLCRGGGRAEQQLCVSYVPPQNYRNKNKNRDDAANRDTSRVLLRVRGVFLSL